MSSFIFQRVIERPTSFAHQGPLVLGVMRQDLSKKIIVIGIAAIVLSSL